MSEDLFCEENDLECGFGQEEDEAMIEHEDDEMESDQIANILKLRQTQTSLKYQQIKT